jgi:hypothetical protein
MRIFDFLRNLVTSFSKDEVKEKLRLIAQAVHETMSTYLTASEILGKPAFKSKAGKEFDTAFKRSVKAPYRGTTIEVIYQVLLNLDSIADLLVSLVEKNYNKDITVDGITYKRAEIIRVLGFMDFTVTYARQLLHYILVTEANVQAKTLPDGKECPKPEIEWLKENQETFFRLINTFATKDREFIKKIEDIPEIGVGADDEHTIVPTVGIQRLDPLKNNFVPGVTPMFMSIGIWWTQMQVARYERMKEDIRCIEFRIEQLRLQAQGKNDPQLEKTIARYEEFKNDLAQDIAKAEQKWK